MAAGSRPDQGQLAKAAYAAPAPRRRNDWEMLHRLEKISILKIGYGGMVGVPILSIFILEWNRQYPGAATNLPIHLFFLFLGSLLLSLSNLVSEMLCPPLIAEYGRLDNYRLEIARAIESQNTIYQASRITTRVLAAHDLDELGVEDEKARDTFEKALASVHERMEVSKKLADAFFFMVSNYGEEWRKENESKMFARWLILTSYVLAALCFAIPITRYLVVVSDAAFPSLR